MVRTAWWDRPCLVWSDDTGAGHRLWVANNVILDKIGLPVLPISLSESRAFEYEGILLHPELVEDVVSSLARREPNAEVERALRAAAVIPSADRKVLPLDKTSSAAPQEPPM